MKGEKQDLSRAVLIARGLWDVPVRVRLGPYMQLCCRLDGELSRLVARWAHAAAPNAVRLRRRVR
jgi:hypothetical protein